MDHRRHVMRKVDDDGGERRDGPPPPRDEEGGRRPPMFGNQSGGGWRERQAAKAAEDSRGPPPRDAVRDGSKEEGWRARGARDEPRCGGGGAGGEDKWRRGPRDDRGARDERE